MTNKRSVVIVGAGAIGSALAMACSKRSDLNVTAVGRSEHVARINENGLKVSGINRETVAFSARTDIPVSLNDSLVILAVKAFDLETTLEQMKPALGPNTMILLVQNGYGIKELAARVVNDLVPHGNIFTGIVGMAVTFEEPGHIQFWGGNVRLDPDFSTSGYADVFEGTPVKAKISKNIQRDTWRKLVINSVVNPLSVLLRTTNRLIADQRLDSLKRDLLDEGQAVAKAAGHDLDMDLGFFNQFIETDNYTSMYQDMAKGRKTEVDFINGGIVAEAARLGVDAPLNAWVRDLIKAVEIARQEGLMREFPTA